MKGAEMVDLFALAGGAIAAGLGVYRYFTQNEKQLQTEAVAGQSTVVPPQPQRFVYAP